MGAEGRPSARVAPFNPHRPPGGGCTYQQTGFAHRGFGGCGFGGLGGFAGQSGYACGTGGRGGFGGYGGGGAFGGGADGCYPAGGQAQTQFDNYTEMQLDLWVKAKREKDLQRCGVWGMHGLPSSKYRVAALVYAPV